MKPEVEQEDILDITGAVREVQSDILALGEYIARKRGMSLTEFLEHLIMKEAGARKEASE